MEKWLWMISDSKDLMNNMKIEKLQESDLEELFYDEENLRHLLYDPVTEFNGEYQVGL